MSQGVPKQSSLEESQDISVYDLFILVLSFLSLFTLLVIFLPSVGNTENSIAFYLDTIFSLIFLADFFYSLYWAQDRKRYFKGRGWMDLVGSIPLLPILHFFRVARALQILRDARRMGWRSVLKKYRQSIPESVFWTTALAVILLLTATSLLIVPFESSSPDTKIANPIDAMWWSIVTATTVGYGDLVPVTRVGRFLASILMIVSLAFISILTSYLTSKLYLTRDVERAEQAEEFEIVHDRLEQIDRRLQRIEALLEKQDE